MKTLDVKPFLLSCQTDLRLRAAGIRRFAEREGRLPDTLALCERDTVGLREWLDWNLKINTRYDEHDFEAVMNVNHFFNRSRNAYYVRNNSLDLFGLPIIYVRREGIPNDPSYIRSSDPLSEVKSYLKEKGGIAAPAPAPFALSSPVLRYAISMNRDVEESGSFCLFVGCVGMIIAALTTTVILFRWKGPRLSRSDGWSLIGATFGAILICVIVLFILGHISVAFLPVGNRRYLTLYDLDPSDRLRLLGDVIRRGEASEEVVRRSRDYIEKATKAP
jgi:uncharacterized membrane protein